MDHVCLKQGQKQGAWHVPKPTSEMYICNGQYVGVMYTAWENLKECHKHTEIDHNPG